MDGYTLENVACKIHCDLFYIVCLPDAKVGGGATMGVFPPVAPESSGIRGEANDSK